MQFIAIRLIISLASSLYILSRQREEKRKESHGLWVTKYNVARGWRLRYSAQTTSLSPSLSTLLLVITVRRFTAGRLFYSKIHVDGRIRGHSNTEFHREQNGTNIPPRNLLSVAAPRGRFIARVNSPGWETPDVMDRKPTPTSLSSQCHACATGEPDRVFD